METLSLTPLKDPKAACGQDILKDALEKAEARYTLVYWNGLPYSWVSEKEPRVRVLCLLPSFVLENALVSEIIFSVPK